MNKVTLLVPDKSEKITIVSYMEKYFLKKGYHKFKEKSFTDKYLLKFFYKPLRKINIILNLIKNSNFIFKNPKKKNIIIYDCEGTINLLKVVPDKNYEIISTRVDRMEKIYITKNIIFYIIKNFFKKSLKQNYIAALVKDISPKIVLTNIDKSSDFHITAKIFKYSDIKFLAVQSSGLEGSDFMKETKAGKNFFIPEFLCFSNFDKELINKNKRSVNKFYTVGSLRSSLAKEYVKIKKIDINPGKYDICLISEQNPVTSEDYSDVENFEEVPGTIAEYAHRLCKKKNLKIIFSGRGKSDDLNSDEEIFFYEEFLKNYDFKISQSSSDAFGTPINIMQSKIVIGHCSTTLREAFSFEKKVLAVQYKQHPDIIFPADGLCLLKNSSYDDFEERVLKILSMTKKEYDYRLSKKTDFIMENKINTADFVRNRLKEILKNS